MDTNFELYKGKSFSDLCKDIYVNQITRKQQIDSAISELLPLVKTTNDALMVVPLIKGYVDSANANDDHLIKLAAIVQKIMNSQQSAESNGSLSITDEEKKQIMADLNSIGSDSITIKPMAPIK